MKARKKRLHKPPIIAVLKAMNYEGEVRNMYVCVRVCVSGVSGGIKALTIILHMVTG